MLDGIEIITKALTFSITDIRDVADTVPRVNGEKVAKHISDYLNSSTN